jgi:hypothetical protein
MLSFSMRRAEAAVFAVEETPAGDEEVGAFMSLLFSIRNQDFIWREGSARGKHSACHHAEGNFASRHRDAKWLITLQKIICLL